MGFWPILDYNFLLIIKIFPFENLEVMLGDFMFGTIVSQGY